jgi:hypothetical protein
MVDEKYYPCLIVGNNVPSTLQEVETEVSAMTCLDQAYSYVKGDDFAMGVITYPGMTTN